MICCSIRCAISTAATRRRTSPKCPTSSCATRSSTPQRLRPRQMLICFWRQSRAHRIKRFLPRLPLSVPTADPIISPWSWRSTNISTRRRRRSSKRTTRARNARSLTRCTRSTRTPKISSRSTDSRGLRICRRACSPRCLCPAERSMRRR